MDRSGSGEICRAIVDLRNADTGPNFAAVIGMVLKKGTAARISLRRYVAKQIAKAHEGTNRVILISTPDYRVQMCVRTREGRWAAL